MYLYTSVPLFAETKGGYGCCTYRRGLSALFVLGGGHCEGLEHGTDEGKIPTPLLYILAGITIIRSSNGNPGDAHLQNDMIHAGQLIERTLHEQGRTVTWFASQLCCTRPNVYKIFRKENIDIHLLWRISCILNHDFFHDLSDSISTGSSSGVSK